jgi:hypothetical protein
MSPKSVLDSTIDSLLEQALHILEWRKNEVLSDVITAVIRQDSLPTWERMSPTTFKANQHSSRSVRFSFEVQVQSTISRHDMSPQERRACWWTSSEHKANTTKATSLLKLTRQQGQSFVKRTINRSLDRALILAQGLHDQDSEAEALLADRRTMSSWHLREWTMHCKGRRGLESQIVDHPAFADLVRERRQLVISSLKHRSMSLSELGVVSSWCSLPSRIFARMKGVEDEQFAYNMSYLHFTFNSK